MFTLMPQRPHFNIESLFAHLCDHCLHTEENIEQAQARLLELAEEAVQDCMSCTAVALPENTYLIHALDQENRQMLSDCAQELALSTEEQDQLFAMYSYWVTPQLPDLVWSMLPRTQWQLTPPVQKDQGSLFQWKSI